MKKWLLFGPGGIGRGLIAPIAFQSSHQIIFASKNEEQVRFLKNNPRYKVICYPPLNEERLEKEIGNYQALLSTDLPALSSICSQEDLKIISTSVRVDNLESVAKVLAPALKERKEKIIILVCENVENGGDKFRGYLEKEIKGLTKKAIIPNLSVDCFVPPQKFESLEIIREKFGELLIEKPKDKEASQYLEKLPNVRLIEGKVLPYYKKKIMGVSGLHAGIAWLGFDKGLKYVHQAANNSHLKEIIEKLISELSLAILKETKFPKKEILDYLKQTRIRIGNPNLLDPNERFFRNLRNKLNKNERFLGPALTIWKKGVYPSALLKILAIGLRKLIKDEKLKNPKKVIKEVCQLPKSAKKLEKEIIKLIS